MLEALNKRIETPNVEEHEKELSEQLSYLMLSFSEKKYLEEKEAGHTVTFGECLEKYTNFLNLPFFPTDDELRIGHGYLESDIEQWKQTFKEELDVIYQAGGNWQNNILEHFHQRGSENKTNERPGTAKVYAGLINYNLRKGSHSLEDYGFDRDLDQVMEVHLEEIFKSADRKVSPQKLRESLQELAIVIVDQFPQVKALIAESWLLDHPIMQRMGFKVTDKTSQLSTMNNWMQFVDKDGQIDKKRAQILLETGEFPFKSRVGYFPIIDFLKKYLPAERKKSPIILRDLKPEFRTFHEQLDEDIKKLNQSWSSFKVEDIEPFIETLPSLLKLLNDMGIYKEFIATLCRMKEKHNDWVPGREAEIEAFKQLEDKLKEYLDKNAFTNREVFLD
ncbi:MAG: hypothetical protein WCV69_00290 [Patescibacteria group bacterium]|jgi:hypothetical protein